VFGWLRKWTGGAQKNAPLPIPQGPLDEAALMQALNRPCAPIVFRKPANIDPFMSMFGTVRLGLKDEAWPAQNGAPMWPMCQFNLTHAPVLPNALRDLSLITIFMSPDDSRSPTQVINTARPDPKATWMLRSYSTLDGLTIPKPPAHASTLSPCLGEWSMARPDYGNHDVAGQVVDTQANDIYAYDWAEAVTQTKLGGWPATVQSEPWWDYSKGKDTWDFVLQIENEPNAGWHGWGDGAAYIARSRERPHLWAIDVQFS
jgi:hypothetical protein